MLWYIGGKANISDWITGKFPPHDIYVSVFGGMMWDILSKRKAKKFEVYNDINGDAVNMFRQIVLNKDKLKRLLTSYPYSRGLYQTFLKEWRSGYKGEDDIERASRYFYLQNACFSGEFGSGFGVTKTKNEGNTYRNKIDKIDEVYKRIKEIIFENTDYENIIELYDSDKTLFYCDPPYYGAEDYYLIYDDEGNIKKDLFTVDDHKRLSELLKNIKGKFFLSYYQFDGLEDMYPEDEFTYFYKDTIKTSRGITRGNSEFSRGKEMKATELLITNIKYDKLNKYMK